MWGDIQKSKILAIFPFDMIRSLRGTFNGSPLAKQMAKTGRNFRNVLDPVSAYGMHYGPVSRFWASASTRWTIFWARQEIAVGRRQPARPGIQGVGEL